MADPFNPYLHRSTDAPFPHTDYGEGMLPTGDKHYHLSFEESQFLAMKRGVDLQRGNNLPPSSMSNGQMNSW